MRRAIPGARDRPPTRGVRASQSRAPAFGRWPGTCPRAGTRCSPRASPVSPCSPPSSARSRRGPSPLAPAALPDQGRRRLRARAPRQPHANFPPAAATLGGGGGGGRGRGQERPAGGAAAEGPRLPLRAPARASALPPRPRGATRRPGAPARQTPPCAPVPAPASRTPVLRNSPGGRRPADLLTQSSLGRPPPGEPRPANCSSQPGKERWTDRWDAW